MKSSAHDLYGCGTRCSCSLLEMRPLRPNCTVHLCSSNTGGAMQRSVSVFQPETGWLLGCHKANTQEETSILAVTSVKKPMLTKSKIP